MNRLATMGLVTLVLVFTSASASAGVKIIGSWDWLGADPLENDITPGTNDAVALNGAWVRTFSWIETS